MCEDTHYLLCTHHHYKRIFYVYSKQKFLLRQTLRCRSSDAPPGSARCGAQFQNFHSFRFFAWLVPTVVSPMLAKSESKLPRSRSRRSPAPWPAALPREFSIRSTSPPTCSWSTTRRSARTASCSVRPEVSARSDDNPISRLARLAACQPQSGRYIFDFWSICRFVL